MRKIYFNGNIITVNEKEPTIDAVLVENGRTKLRIIKM